nr:ATP-grasp domain-containing protein [uncultured Carboxylicivirga sp.]
MNILITSAGRRVSLLRAFQKELKKFFPDSKVFATDLEPGLSSACQVADGSFKVERVDSPNYIDMLIELCKQHNIRMIIPTIDPELRPLAENKLRFEQEGIQCIVSDFSNIVVCRNKRLTHQLFEELNINYAREYAHDKPQFPLFIKPIDGSCSKDIYHIKGPHELCQRLIDDENLMFLEYIDQEVFKEYTVDMYFDRNGILKCLVPRERIEIRSGEIFKGITVKNGLVSYLTDRFSEVKGYIGCITLQVFYNEDLDKVYGIEINPRFGGGYPLSYQAGANYPRWIIQEYFLNESIEYFDNWEDQLLMLRYDDEILVHGASFK